MFQVECVKAVAIGREVSWQSLLFLKNILIVWIDLLYSIFTAGQARESTQAFSGVQLIIE